MIFSSRASWASTPGSTQAWPASRDGGSHSSSGFAVSAGSLGNRHGSPCRCGGPGGRRRSANAVRPVVPTTLPTRPEPEAIPQDRLGTGKMFAFHRDPFPNISLHSQSPRVGRILTNITGLKIHFPIIIGTGELISSPRVAVVARPAGVLPLGFRGQDISSPRANDLQYLPYHSIGTGKSEYRSMRLSQRACHYY